MCGIGFVLSKKNLKITDDYPKHFMDHLFDRGPDNQSFYLENNFCLISTRLSVIDTDKRSNQPFYSNCGNYIIIFNGMIYNYKDLKQKYLQDFNFKTDSDTEVILNMYIKFGVDCSKYLDGMFAFIIHDKKQNDFFISRDKTGIKPLYYCSNDEFLYFSSSFKSLLKFSKKNISQKGLINYLNFGYSLEPNTIIDDIKIFPNASYAKINQFKFETKKYLQLEDIYFKKNYLNQYDFALVEKNLSEAVKKHTITDVPMCLFLSSGFDSNIIASICKKLKIKIDTITLGFERFRNTKNDETIFVNELNSFYGFKNKIIYVTDEELVKLKKKFDNKIDHPSTDGFNTFIITYYAKKLGYKVAISGLGGDEIFNTYGNVEKIALVKNLNFVLNLFKIKKLFKTFLESLNFSKKIKNIIQKDLKDLSLYIFARSLFLKDEIKNVAEKQLNFFIKKEINYDEIQNLNELDEKLFEKKISFFESNIYMKNQLLRDSDWSSMANSIELRVPFANSEVINFFSNLKNNRKSREKILRKINYDVYKLIRKKPKTGFSVPIEMFLDKQKDNPYRKFSLNLIKEYLNRNLNANY
jgi:asparagine synthase (glutamine-hydrolysing)